VLNSSSLELCDEHEATSIAKHNHHIFEAGARNSLGGCFFGGRCIISGVASISLLFLDIHCVSAQKLQIPFAAMASCGSGRTPAKVVFDEVETNLVLVLERDEGNAHSIDRFDTTLPSGAEIQPAGSDIRDSTSSASEPITESNCGLIADMTGGKVSKAVCDVFQIDASTRQSFVVSVSEAEKQSLLQQCRRCIGFTEGQSQCKNQCITNSQWPWCHNHVDQERDFATFRSTGSRPHWCGWWPDAQHIFA
jgi:hypothetical protein